VLRLTRMVAVAAGMTFVITLYFLQEHEVSIEPVQTLAYFMNHEPAIEKRQPFVNIVSRDVQCIGHRFRLLRRYICFPKIIGQEIIKAESCGQLVLA